MKKNILFFGIFFYVVLFSLSLQAWEIDSAGDMNFKECNFVHHSYSASGDVGLGFSFSPSLIISPDNSKWEIKLAGRFNLSTPDIYKGVDILGRNGENPFLSLREAYWENQWFRIGKQLFADEEGIKFDFTEINPFVERDLSEPFRLLEKDKRLGNWGVSFFPREELTFIFSLAEPPFLPLDADNHWTRPLPPSFFYGHAHQESDFSWGVYWGKNIFWWGRDIQFNLFFQHGTGASPVDIKTNFYQGEVRPVFAQQTILALASSFPLASEVIRLGVSHFWQNGYNDFILAIAEVEREWENLFRAGDNLFLEIGLADDWKTDGGGKRGIKEIDLRRAYEGGSILATAEYSPSENWVMKIKSVYNLSISGIYFSPEIMWKGADDRVEVSLRGEIISGSSTTPSPANNIFAEYKNNDGVYLSFQYHF